MLNPPKGKKLKEGQEPVPPENQGNKHSINILTTGIDGVRGNLRRGTSIKKIATIKIRDGDSVIRIDAPIETSDTGLLFTGLREAVWSQFIFGRMRRYDLNII